jgi:hypothetical protein
MVQCPGASFARGTREGGEGELREPGPLNYAAGGRWAVGAVPINRNGQDSCAESNPETKDSTCAF